MAQFSSSSYQQAVSDFRQARQRAGLEAVLSRLTGKSTDLLPYSEVRAHLKGIESAREQLKEIPLDAIIGSVGRYTDFSRSFLPLKETDRERWAQVKMASEQLQGLPPIDVYQIGEFYFVRDGHHRASIARQNGFTHIQAYVTMVSTAIPLTAEDRLDDIIIKAEYANFLEQTKIDRLRPDVDLLVSAPGQYKALLEHISVHRYYMGIDQNRPIDYPEAVTDWYDSYYLPITEIIHQRNILRDFPDRTATDLYLWVTEYRSALAAELGWVVGEDTTINQLSTHFSRNPLHHIQHTVKRVIDHITPDELESGPETGLWRQERHTIRKSESLFDNILIAVTGDNSGWHALDFAIDIAHREGAWIGGLYVVSAPDEKESPAIQSLQTRFDEKCNAAQVPGKLVVEAGKIARTITERSKWVDLAVLRLAHPPPLKLLPRLGSGLRTIIRRISTPVLVVPETATPIQNLLLAYDGSPKAKEALYIAAYLCGRWGMKLTVITQMKNAGNAQAHNQQARAYLESQGITADYLHGSGQPAEAILKTANDRAIDLILMGSYGAGPLREMIFGSTVDRVLNRVTQCVLICK